MEKQIIIRLRTSFGESAHQQEGIEFWFARDLQKLLDKTPHENH